MDGGRSMRAVKNDLPTPSGEIEDQPGYLSLLKQVASHWLHLALTPRRERSYAISQTALPRLQPPTRQSRAKSGIGSSCAPGIEGWKKWSREIP